MSDGQMDGVEALLEEARLVAWMPAPAERLRLREAAGLSRAQVAAAVGVGRQTVANWESGETDPQPPGRGKYLKLLKGLAELHPAPTAAPEVAGPLTPTSPAPVGEFPATAFRADGLVVQGELEPCIRCGVVTPFKATDGRSLHPGGLCLPATTLPAGTPASPAEPANPQASAPAAPVRPSPTPVRVPSRPQRRAQSSARAQAETNTLIVGAVHEELERAEGDADVALQALVKRAIPDVMRLFEETRATARYQYTAY
ncbi:helix-turn-helix domain-containing protein, partial [Streptomyces noursei]|uniref:helix-turn-helix transcriptional regulator n=1 Tax=Streptomyces noursei TaxID=1971 RepID=UPI003800C3B8